MKRLVALLIIGCMLVLGSCTTPPKPETPSAPPLAPAELHMRMGLQIWSWYLKYDIAGKKPLDYEKCYKGMKVTSLPDKESNIWYRAGLREGDFIVMVESRPGFMATLNCSNEDEVLMRWFPGKARENLCTNPLEVWTKMQPCDPDSDGFWIERLRWKEAGEFELETLRVKYE